MKLNNCNVDFELLDRRHIERKYKLREVKLVGGILYIVSQRDEWYIQANEYGVLELFHKNKWNDTRKYHKESRKFKTVFNIFSYLNRHDEYIYEKSFKQIRMDRLFQMI